MDTTRPLILNTYTPFSPAYYEKESSASFCDEGGNREDPTLVSKALVALDWLVPLKQLVPSIEEEPASNKKRVSNEEPSSDKEHASDDAHASDNDTVET